MFKRKCVVKNVDGFGIEHAAKVPAESRGNRWLVEGEISNRKISCFEPASPTSQQCRLQRDRERSRKLATDCHGTVRKLYRDKRSVGGQMSTLNREA
jgi:hypothetical protein